MNKKKFPTRPKFAINVCLHFRRHGSRDVLRYSGPTVDTVMELYSLFASHRLPIQAEVLSGLGVLNLPQEKK